jgi:hypothetical protein
MALFGATRISAVSLYEVFKTGALNHSATLPFAIDQILSDIARANLLATSKALDPGRTDLPPFIWDGLQSCGLNRGLHTGGLNPLVGHSLSKGPVRYFVKHLRLRLNKADS